MLDVNRAGSSEGDECGKLRERMEGLVDLSAWDVRRYKGRKGRRDEDIEILPGT